MREGISKAIIMSVVENSTVKLDNNGQECYQITENQLAKLTSDLKNKFIETKKNRTMRTVKVLDTIKEDTKCNNLTILAYRNDDGEDGVLFTAWHEVDGTRLIQTDFIKMDIEHISRFIIDYSPVSAQDYVDRFKP